MENRITDIFFPGEWTGKETTENVFIWRHNKTIVINLHLCVCIWVKYECICNCTPLQITHQLLILLGLMYCVLYGHCYCTVLSGPHVEWFINLMRLVSMFHGYCVWLACQSSLYSSTYLSGKAFPNPQAIISLVLHNPN